MSNEDQKPPTLAHYSAFLTPVIIQPKPVFGPPDGYYATALNMMYGQMPSIPQTEEAVPDKAPK